MSILEIYWHHYVIKWEWQCNFFSNRKCYDQQPYFLNATEFTNLLAPQKNGQPLFLDIIRKVLKIVHVCSNQTLIVVHFRDTREYIFQRLALIILNGDIHWCFEQKINQNHQQKYFLFYNAYQNMSRFLDILCQSFRTLAPKNP